jgi:Nucleotide-diphospho-sugar transferase
MELSSSSSGLSNSSKFVKNYESYIKDGFFAWTLTSNGYKYLTWNMVLFWKKAVKDIQICVICADRPSYIFLQREGIQCILLDQTIVDYGPQIVPFGSRNFSFLNRIKLRLLSLFANNPSVKQCLYLDGDIIVYKDIVSNIKERLSEAELVFQCDEKDRECLSHTLNIPCPNLCTGLIAWNHGADKGIFQITDEAVWDSKPEDQVWVNYSLQKNKIPATSLSRILYPNGMRVGLTKNTPELLEKAICLHYNYRVGNSKKIDMKRFGDWLLPY